MQASEVKDWSGAKLQRNHYGWWSVLVPDQDYAEWGYWDTKREAQAFLDRHRQQQDGPDAMSAEAAEQKGDTH